MCHFGHIPIFTGLENRYFVWSFTFLTHTRKEDYFTFANIYLNWNSNKKWRNEKASKLWICWVWVFLKLFSYSKKISIHDMFSGRFGKRTLWWLCTWKHIFSNPKPPGDLYFFTRSPLLRLHNDFNWPRKCLIYKFSWNFILQRVRSRSYLCLNMKKLKFEK